jgi:transaldolase
MSERGKNRPSASALDFDDAVAACGRPSGATETRPLAPSPLLSALRRAGTSHVYADTADTEELGKLLATAGGAIVAEVDGNTANQPLVRKVVDRYLAAADLKDCTDDLRRRGDLAKQPLPPLLYAIVCGRIGNDFTRAFASGRAWEVSLQIHMSLASDVEAAKRIGRHLRRMVPTAFVKVPFAPYAPQCFFIARDLERQGIPVNFTSTFSARQAVVAALLGEVTRTNIFMGRLNQGLEAALLGEHVDLEAQRQLKRLRAETGAKTQLIVASMRDWQTFMRVAGCDVFTAPCEAIRDFLAQTEVAPQAIRSQLETSYEDSLGISDKVLKALGTERIARLYRVEPELVEFLLELRSSAEWSAMRDGERLARRFDEAGFGDFFYVPSTGEWEAMKKNKLPDLEAPVTKRLALDTLFSLLADADFENHQAEIDRKIAERLGA